MTNAVTPQSADDAIIEALRVDGRATVRSIAASLNLPESTTRARVNNLLESGRVTVTAMLHPAVARNTVSTYLRVRLLSGVDVHAASEALAWSYWTAQIVGQPELLTSYDVASVRDIADLMDDVARMPIVSDVVADAALSVHVGGKTPEDSGVGAVKWPDDLDPNLDAFDRQLIRALELDGRASFTTLAQQTGLSLSQTRRRVLQLIESGTIRIWSIVESEDARLARGLLELRAGIKNMAETIERLMLHEGVVSVSRMLGSMSLLLELTADDETALDDVMAKLMAEQGVHLIRFERIRLLKRRLQDRSLSMSVSQATKLSQSALR